ncbi:type II secretion system F family protein [Roseicyclus persicicus]|uniref:Type II secretion system protein GspF domain-containing protein n=1 Tax=Roseicyclus persicicus TaxID=2650661 RepID=A0A7X6JVC8_9RHOB|nr:type II secretion system F family protein [Roseibacterium persicicum]NKX43197.1 hypothetical protein [Roseibacterium persicicum]
MMARLTDPAVILLLVFAAAMVSLALSWRADRRKSTRRLETVLKASRAARARSGARPADGPAQALRATWRPRSAFAKGFGDFLVAAGYRGSVTGYLRTRAILAIALGYGLSLLNPLGWVAYAASALLVAGASYLVAVRAIRKRTTIMEAEFPAAIDIMVRGIRTGMPLIESMRVVASEAHPVVAREFRTLIDELALGIRFSDAMQRMVPRMPIADIQFFAVVLGLQAESGGAVADTLQSAAETMRSRRELREKVSIMSREARSSAAIIGSLPVIVSAVMAFTSPEYIGLLLTTPLGNLVALGALTWALVGILVMRAMINFEI